jgi:hypothetical protein
VLFLGFSPLILACDFADITVAEITDSTKKFLQQHSSKYHYMTALEQRTCMKKFNWVVAVDEYFTFVDSETQQIDRLTRACDMAQDLLVTTLRDYKNQDFRSREFSQPQVVHGVTHNHIYLEHHDYATTDRNAWQSQVWELQGAGAVSFGPFARRNMFFKQMAKFSMDAGARNFHVHKNLMYKSLIKKNYEHVISITQK